MIKKQDLILLFIELFIVNRAVWPVLMAFFWLLCYKLGENNSPDNASNVDKKKGCDEKSPLLLKSSKDQKSWIYEPASFIGSNAKSLPITEENHLLSHNI